MKYIYILLLFSALCTAMDQTPQKSILTCPQSIIPTTLAFPSNDLIALGGKGGCALMHTNNSQTLIDSVDVFSLAAYKQQNPLLVITNTKELFVYDVIKKSKPWQTNALATKNMCVQFTPDKKILTLDVKNNKIYLFDWEKNISTTYNVLLYNPNWVKTPLISCAQQNNNLLVGYIGDKQHPSVATISGNTVTIKQFVSDQPSLYSQEALLNHNSEFVAIVDWIKGCTIWIPQTNKNYSFDGENPSVVASVAFDSQKSYLALLDINGWALKFYKIETNKPILLKTIALSIRNPQQLNYSKRLDYSPDNKQVAVLGENQIELVSVPELALYKYYFNNFMMAHRMIHFVHDTIFHMLLILLSPIYSDGFPILFQRF